MKLTVNHKELADAAGWAARMLPSRPSVPVLAGLQVQATEGGRLSLSAFDYDVSGRVTIDASVGEPGGVLVSGRAFANVVSKLSSKHPVELEVVDDHLAISAGTGRFSMALLPMDDYPKLPDLPDPAGETNAAILKDAVRAVVTAASSDDTLPALTAICMIPGEDALELVTTDRYRLGLARVPWETEQTFDEGFKILVPAATFADFTRALDDGTVSIGYGTQAAYNDMTSGLVSFTSKNYQVTTRTIAGEFPRYQSLLPKSVTTSLVVDPDELAAAIKRVAVAREHNTPVHMTFSADDIALDAGDEATLMGSDVVAVKDFDGDSLKTNFNPDYFCDCLAAIDGPARLGLTGNKPVLVSADVKDPAIKFLLMPIRPAGE